MLAQAILGGIANERVLTESHPVIPTPLKNLIQGYNKHALAHAGLPVITEKTTGAQLKAAISRLAPEYQVELLHAYCKDTRRIHTGPYLDSRTDEARAVEDKKLRLLLGRIVAGLLAVIALLLLGGVLAVASAAGVLQDIVSAKLVGTSTEIAKFIFWPPKGP
jgi:hypothetical protein